MTEVKVYTTEWCPYCTRAKALLTRKGVPFTEVDVGDDPTTRAWLKTATGRHTVPQVFIGGKAVGGCDDLHALERSGELDRLLSR